MRAIVLGARGQVGHSLCPMLGNDVLAITKDAFDFTQLSAIEKTLDTMADGFNPEIIINLAAYTNVEQAEIDKDLATTVNAHAPKEIAAWCNKHRVPILHTSTDYVFDGQKQSPYTERDDTNPLNHYGISKLAGEHAVLESGAKAIVLRLSWVYSVTHAHSFVRKIMARAATDKTLNVVADQVGSPTSAAAAAKAIAALLQKLPASGIYHATPQGHTSWHGFACAIMEEAGITLESITPTLTHEFATKAKRPANSRLDSSKLAKAGIVIPHWREGLKEVMKKS
ncbi:MAG: dTDP-4-dehydrorhamnose reductase [Alphaproteobacteria bacterium]|nr:dTDP-4-dehydrorhamnose reductase [Alphaproteobacteria bacterium]